MDKENVCIWLNNMVYNLHVVHKAPSVRRNRSFDSSTSTKGPLGSFMVRKPDICVIDRSDRPNMTQESEPMHWRKIFAIVEVTSVKPSRPALEGVLSQVSEKSACIFDVQPQRRFTCALIFIGKPGNIEFSFVVVDRCSLIHTPLTPLTSTNVFDMLRIVYALCFGPLETIGWDPAVKLNPLTKEVVSITITGYELNSTILTTRTFKIVKLLHSSAVLYSRGTRVWIVSDEQGRFYILKDSWISNSRNVSEIDFIKHIERTIKDDPEGYLYQYICPRYCIGQDEVWCTDNIRSHLLKPRTRYHRRIVTGPIGDPITSFRSKAEFITAFLDIVNGISFLKYADCGYANFCFRVGLS